MFLISNRNRFLIVQVTLTSCPGHYKTFLLGCLCVSTPPYYSAPTDRSLQGSQRDLSKGPDTHKHTWETFQWFLAACTMKILFITMVSKTHMTGQLLWLQLLSLFSLFTTLQPTRHSASQIHLILLHLQAFAHAVAAAKSMVFPTSPWLSLSHSSRPHSNVRDTTQLLPVICAEIPSSLFTLVLPFTLLHITPCLLLTAFVILCSFLIYLLIEKIYLPTRTQAP